VPESQVGLKLSGTHQRVVYTDIANVTGENLDTIYEKNTETFIDGRKEVGLELNTEM
jgi:hypothetical protein